MNRANPYGCKAETKELFKTEINSAIFDINYCLDECIILIISSFKFIELHKLELISKRFYLLSKNAPQWLTLHAHMVNLVGIDQLKPMPQIIIYKDIACNALKNPENLLIKCIFHNNNIDLQRGDEKLLSQVLLIKNNENDIAPKLKIKFDLLHAGLITLRREFGVEYDYKDNEFAQDLVQSILDSALASSEEKSWAICLSGLLFYYNRDELIINGNALTNQEIALLLQTVVNNADAPPSHKAIANFYQDLLQDQDLTDIEEEDLDGTEYYEQIHMNSQDPHLPPSYKAKCILQMALMDYYDDIEDTTCIEVEHNRRFAAFHQVIVNEFAFPRDKISAMLHQAIMKYRDLVQTITYDEAEKLLDKIITNKAIDSKVCSTAKMYKASMNFAKQVNSMTDEEIFEEFNNFVEENIYKELEDMALAKLNMGLMLIGKPIQHISLGEARAKAFVLFTEVSKTQTSIEEYKIQAEYQLSIFHDPFKG